MLRRAPFGQSGPVAAHLLERARDGKSSLRLQPHSCRERKAVPHARYMRMKVTPQSTNLALLSQNHGGIGLFMVCNSSRRFAAFIDRERGNICMTRIYSARARKGDTEIIEAMMRPENGEIRAEIAATLQIP